MHVSEESTWVLLNLGDVEVLASVNTVGEDTSLEWSLHAANAESLFWAAFVCWVGECQARWARLAASCLVNVGRSVGHGLVGSVAEVAEADVVADAVSCVSK